MCAREKFLVFYMKNGHITEFLGTTGEGAQVNGEDAKPGRVTLPKEFMMGKTFDAFIYNDQAGSPQLAFVSLDAKPITL